MSGKRAKENRKQGLDRRSQVKQRLIEKFNRQQLRAIKEAEKWEKGEEFDPNIVIRGLSEAEQLTMKGHATPSEMIFKRLIAKRCVRIVQDEEEGKIRLVPTVLGLIVADILHKRLTVIPRKKIKVTTRDDGGAVVSGLKRGKLYLPDGVEAGRVDCSKENQGNKPKENRDE